MNPPCTAQRSDLQPPKLNWRICLARCSYSDGLVSANRRRCGVEAVCTDRPRTGRCDGPCDRGIGRVSDAHVNLLCLIAERVPLNGVILTATKGAGDGGARVIVAEADLSCPLDWLQ